MECLLALPLVGSINFLFHILLLRDFYCNWSVPWSFLLISIFVLSYYSEFCVVVAVRGFIPIWVSMENLVPIILFLIVFYILECLHSFMLLHIHSSIFQIIFPNTVV